MIGAALVLLAALSFYANEPDMYAPPDPCAVDLENEDEVEAVCRPDMGAP